jgi:hypothetical protein
VTDPARSASAARILVRMRGSLALAPLAALVGLLWLVPTAASHPLGCRFPPRQSPVGDTSHVYAIPHGCIRLHVPADDTRLPTVVVRRHDVRGRAVVRRFPLPDTNLDRANGSIGVCGHDSSYLFVVAYPFVTVVAQEQYALDDGRRECASEVESSLLWTGYLSGPPSLRMSWHTHRPNP